MSETIDVLRAMSDDELVAKHDRVASHTQVGTLHYARELERRETARQGDRIEALTREMHRSTKSIQAYTFWMLIFTALNLLGVILPLLIRERS